LSGRPIAAGEWRVTCAFAFSAGDLLMVTVLRRLHGSGLLEKYPNLSAYVARGEARPAYKRAFGDQFAVFTGKPPTG
jgi:glutathione S-transferase